MSLDPRRIDLWALAPRDWPGRGVGRPRAWLDVYRPGARDPPAVRGPLTFEEPTTTPLLAAAWPFVLAGVLAAGEPTALVLLRPVGGSMQAPVEESRAANEVAAELAVAYGGRGLRGDAADHANAIVAAAIDTLERLDGEGWRSVLGEAPGGGERLRLGGDAVTKRTEAFDPFAAAPVGAR